MKKPAVWIGIAFVTAVLAFVLVSSMRTGRYRCEICITFNGQRDCRIAAADTREHAIRTATENICAQLASGVTESGHCEQTRPDSLRWLE